MSKSSFRDRKLFRNVHLADVVMTGPKPEEFPFYKLVAAYFSTRLATNHHLVCGWKKWDMYREGFSCIFHVSIGTLVRSLKGMFSHLANGPWNKSLNFIFPTKYGIMRNRISQRCLAGWWFEPIWKIWVKLEIFPKVRGEKDSIWNHHLDRIWSWRLTYSLNWTLKWMIWGYHYFWKHPCLCLFLFHGFRLCPFG